MLDAEQVLALKRVLQNPLLPRFNVLADRFGQLAEFMREFPVESIKYRDARLTSIGNTASSVAHEAQRLAEQAEAYRVLWSKEA